jgi:hypothetical protein
VAELLADGCRGTGATLIGARVTPISGFCVGSGAERVQSGWLYVGAELVSSAGGGGGGGSGGGGALTGGASKVVSAGRTLVDGCGATDVDSAGRFARPVGQMSRTTGTATAAAISAIVACFVRYHGGGGALNVNALLFEARR